METRHMCEGGYESLAERLLAIGRDCAARLGAEYVACDHDSLLYDENGLPLRNSDASRS